MFIIVHPQYCYGQSIDYTINHPSVHPSIHPSVPLSFSFFLTCVLAGSVPVSSALQFLRSSLQTVQQLLQPCFFYFGSVDVQYFIGCLLPELLDLCFSPSLFFFFFFLFFLSSVSGKYLNCITNTATRVASKIWY